MTQLEARAIAMAYELHRVLGEICELPEHGAGTRAEQAWDLMDDVISYLDSDAPDDDQGIRDPNVARDRLIELHKKHHLRG
jgi:hypothetical protein